MAEWMSDEPHKDTLHFLDTHIHMLHNTPIEHPCWRMSTTTLRKYSGNPSLPSEKTGLSKKSCYNLAHGKHSATTHLRR